MEYILDTIHNRLPHGSPDKNCDCDKCKASRSPSNSALAMLPAIGQQVAVRFEEILVNCTVRNVKSSYGRTRLLVTPAAGMGEQWVELPRVTQLAKPGPSTGAKVLHSGVHPITETTCDDENCWCHFQGVS